MAKTKKLEFPKLVYIVRESDESGSWLIAHESADGIDEGAIVAIYKRESPSMFRKVISHDLKEV